ncbi:MAG TPA: translocation/assembly module TamB domain-containing protein [Steroidobacteraceae bacterium]
MSAPRENLPRPDEHPRYEPMFPDRSEREPPPPWDLEPEPRRGWRRPLGWIGISLVALLVLLAAFVAWLLNTESGARFAAARAVEFLHGKLEIQAVRGTIAGPLTVDGFRYRDSEKGVDVRVKRVSLDAALSELFSKRAHVLFVQVNGVEVYLSELTKKKEEPSHFSLKPPLDMLLDRLTLKDAHVWKDRKELFVANSAEAMGSWTVSQGVRIQKLTVDSPDGHVNVAGGVAGPGYVGRATGDFAWRFGERQFAGDLTASSDKEQLELSVVLSAPMGAHVNASLGESKQLPWKLDLNVPQFDPREKLLPGSSLHSLATTLHGEGDLELADVKGDVAINGQRVRIEPLRVRFKDQVLNIDTVTLIDPSGRGRLSASGDMRFGAAAAAAAASENAPPFYANLQVQWKDVSLPKEWVGQPLASQGDLKVVGSTATFTADGQLALGPPDKLADIALAIAGTPQQIEVKQLTIVQKTGDLTVTGRVGLQPKIDWRLTARAKTFDPGAFVAGWPGRLGFALDTKGEMTEQGPSASLDLNDLTGTLRGRELAGQAALSLSPQKIVSGTLNVSSGKSAVHLSGRGGEALDLDTELDIASLEDWVPKSSGRLNGKFHVGGKWPLLAVEGNAQGRDLALGEYSMKTIDVTADVKNPKSPAGHLDVKAAEIIAAGFTFSDVNLTLSGAEKDHSLALTATGQPLTAQVKVHGAYDRESWTGTVDQLTLAATGIEPLSLRQPTQVTWSPKGFSVSESCLAGQNIAACVAADQNEAGELHARYRLEHLPLGLIAALAVPDLPMRIEAVIEGDGNLRRAPDGALFGEAQITSASGRVSDAVAAAQEDAADALLSYENFKLTAKLDGDNAQGSVETSFTGGGKLEGHISAANLRGAAPSLDGSAKLSIADLSPAGLFVPQLADVHGSAEANVTIAGTVPDPRITGNAQLRGLSADVPQVGIKLKNGEMQASLQPGNNVTLTGKVTSGDGQIALDGDTSTDGLLKVKITGKDFMAANIPGAKVIVAPDLDFARGKDKMTLGGTVTIPKADIDLTKLPKAGAKVQHASEDVVVIDDDQQAVEKSKKVPLEAHINVILGKDVSKTLKSDVSLIGYGLNAKVDGQLMVNEVQGEDTTANGEIHVSGTYKAYGQDLTIQQGRLLFGGQSISDPQVNLIATRTVDTVTAKLIVSGSAQKPLLEVQSDPPLPQTQALSYLVTGKPINEVGSGEGDLVQSAARSLGGAAGNLLAKGLGKRLGVSEIGVEDSPELGGSAFTVGQYLSPRLYLSYGVGLFEPGQVVTLRYRINSKVSLEAVQGPLNQKAGINYRIEK